jgi:NADPH:quinone reductase-like Zn-dependent oxidoreductase
VLVGGPKHNRLLGPLGHVGGMVLGPLFSRRKAVFFMADVNRLDLGVLGELIEAGQVRPVVERRYELSDLADGLAYMGEGHVQGKIVMTV